MAKILDPELTLNVQEAKNRTIELKDDDPLAVTLVLRHIYKLPELEVSHPSSSWRLWLNVHLAADKYLEPELSTIAGQNFRRHALVCSDADEIFDLMEAIESEADHLELLVDLGAKLRENNMGKLLKNDRFRAQLDAGGKESLWQQLDELVFAADLEERRFALCHAHEHAIFLPRSGDDLQDSQGKCVMCTQGYDAYGFQRCSSLKFLTQSAWVRKSGG